MILPNHTEATGPIVVVKVFYDARAVAKSLVARCLLLTPKTEMALILAGSETTQNELAAEGIGFAASRLTEEVGWISSLVSSISEENHLRF